MQRLRLLAALGVALAGEVRAGRAPGLVARNIETSWVPKETIDHAGDIARGGAPMPTAPPKAAFGEMELVKRFSGYTMGGDTCGFVASFWGSLL